MKYKLNIFVQFREDAFTIRDPSSHNQQCSEIVTSTELGYMEISDHPTPLAATVMANPGYSIKQSGKITLSTANEQSIY